MTLAQIKPSTVQAWLRGLESTGASPAYRSRILSNVSTILSAAVDDERITKNPCKACSAQEPQNRTSSGDPVDR